MLSYEVDERTGECASSGVILDARRLPRELVDHGKPAVYARRINEWWRHRAVPSTRDGLRNALDALGVRSATELLERSHGLSLSDQYWIRDEDSDLEWKDVNFFHNPFDEEVGRVMLTFRSSSHRFSFNAPDASTGGDLPKRWTIGENSERLLIKAGRTGQEPVNELIATSLARRLGIKAVEYRLGETDNKAVSICGQMLTDTEELVSAWQLLGSVKTDNRLDARDAWLLAAQSFGCDIQAASDATDDWLLVDWLMRNTDRHYNNFGLIRDVETLHVRPAPLFDTGASLWCGEIRIDTGDYKSKPFYATYKTPTARRQLTLVRNWGRYDLDLLDDWPEETARRLASYGMYAPARIDAIRDALKTKVETARIMKQHAGRSRDIDLADRQIITMDDPTGIGPDGDMHASGDIR
ncbi:HipA-like domain-containing protein [Bifidobacterium tsurumiense]|uniref:HipA-like domain-containing protein n=1 Tax=Bifidobacterium tsurumiense TaxID=356829 RepID=A0A087E8C7_9BIFI|nr:HipA-like domain-containing protein [Bifidobacterium tsurumiense]